MSLGADVYTAHIDKAFLDWSGIIAFVCSTFLHRPPATAGHKFNAQFMAQKVAQWISTQVAEQIHDVWHPPTLPPLTRKPGSLAPSAGGSPRLSTSFELRTKCIVSERLDSGLDAAWDEKQRSKIFDEALAAHKAGKLWKVNNKKELHVIPYAPV